RGCGIRTRASRGRLRALEMLEGDIVLTSLPEDAREKRLGLGCSLGVADCQQRVPCDLQCLLVALHVVGQGEGDSQSEQQLGTLAVVRPESKRFLVLRRGDREAVEHESAFACCAQSPSRALAQLVVV